MKPIRSKGLLRRVYFLTIATISWNIVEAGVALSFGLVAGSIALTGFGLDSLIEVSSAFFIFWKLKAATARIAEEREKKARQGIALTFLALAIWISWESISSLLSAKSPAESPAGIMLASLSLLIMPVLGNAKMQAGRALKSRAIQADAVETLVCAWLSASLLAGLGLRYAFGWWWADSVGALLMVPFLLWQFRMTWEEAEERD